MYKTDAKKQGFACFCFQLQVMMQRNTYMF